MNSHAHAILELPARYEVSILWDLNLEMRERAKERERERERERED